MSEHWPPQLKEWVARCLGQISETNKDQVQKELKQVIGEAYSNKTLWTTDWNGVQLQSLMPKPAPIFGLKRKSEDKSPLNHKKKKPAAKNHTNHETFNPNDEDALRRRAQRFEREHEIERQKSYGSYGSQVTHTNSTLLSRVQNSRSASPASWTRGDEPEDKTLDWDKHTIVGTNQQLFKDYLRLTSEPNPKDIRPLTVLEKTLAELKRKWRQTSDYAWICNQFKSLRQDLTVQGIKNEFTVQVYEIHARMALEAGDMVEYNQCQSMLKNYYEMGIKGRNDEFTAYQILLLLHGRNRSDLNLLVGKLTSEQKSENPIKHALDVQRAMSTNNYHAFFELYAHAPNMGAYIMDHFVDRERARALMVISKAYQQMPLTFLTSELAFDNETKAIDYLVEHRAAFFQDANSPDDKKLLNCKGLHAPLAEVFEEKYRKATIKGAI